MLQPTAAHIAVWIIAALATLGVIARPFKWPEAIWAVGGAALILATGLLQWPQGVQALGKGGDVYLFLTGMMLLSETARREGLFDRIAAIAINSARASPKRLFTLVYGVGVLVTAFLSNDAAAVVLTPAVYAATQKAKAEALPYLFICAFVANAASFLLPISNPANIVLYGDHTPALFRWMCSFLLPSLLSIVATYVVLRWVEGRRLGERCDGDVQIQPMSAGAWAALGGLGLTAAALLAASAMDAQLGLPTFIMGVLTVAVVWLREKRSPWPTLKGVSWSVLPLVAGLFVLVQALTATGLTAAVAGSISEVAGVAPDRAAWLGGGLIAVVSNLMNNLPAGLLASAAIAQAHPPQTLVDSLLIGVDLGPNLSVTGSLATILWLTALRREGENVGFWRFLKVGVMVTPPALGLALAARLLLPI